MDITTNPICWNINEKITPKLFIGITIGTFIISDIIRLDDNTTVICCQDKIEQDLVSHLEVEHWRDENTFHYNELFYDKDGNCIGSESIIIPSDQQRCFENVLCSFSQ